MLNNSLISSLILFGIAIYFINNIIFNENGDPKKVKNSNDITYMHLTVVILAIIIYYVCSLKENF
jgi:hypothetical protein